MSSTIILVVVIILLIAIIAFLYWDLQKAKAQINSIDAMFYELLQEINLAQLFGIKQEKRNQTVLTKKPGKVK